MKRRPTYSFNSLQWTSQMSNCQHCVHLKYSITELTIGAYKRELTENAPTQLIIFTYLDNDCNSHLTQQHFKTQYATWDPWCLHLWFWFWHLNKVSVCTVTNEYSSTHSTVIISNLPWRICANYTVEDFENHVVTLWQYQTQFICSASAPILIQCIGPALLFLWVYLRPGSCPPRGHAGHSVTGPPALRLLPTAVLAVYGAVGAFVEELHAAHGADLVAQAAAGFGAVLPVLRNPSAANGEKNNSKI